METTTTLGILAVVIIVGVAIYYLTQKQNGSGISTTEEPEEIEKPEEPSPPEPPSENPTV